MQDSPATGGHTPQLRLESKHRLVARTEFSVFTRADCSLAWEIYCDWKQWRNFADVYDRLEWRGEPWKTESRLLVEITKPCMLRHEARLVVCVPPRCAAWITHADHYQVEQWVMFYPYNGGGTRVAAWAEVNAEESLAQGNQIQQVLHNVLTAWFAGFCRYCNRLVDELGV